MNKHNHDHDRDVDRDRDHDNDNDVRERREKTLAAVASAPAGGAMTSLAALQTALNRVDTVSAVGLSGLPMLQFKSRENNGTWMYGQQRTIPEDGSRWAINPHTFRWGFICFDPNDKPTERTVSVSQPKPDLSTLPAMGDAEWQEQWTVQAKCVSGADAGVEVVIKASTVGGLQAVAGLIETVRDRLNNGEHGGKIVPIVTLEKDSYQHSQYGRVWTPRLPIVGWMPLAGPAPTPEPASPPPPEQPRRRRVA
jgi:hypothetical protein